MSSTDQLRRSTLPPLPMLPSLPGLPPLKQRFSSVTNPLNPLCVTTITPIKGQVAIISPTIMAQNSLLVARPWTDLEPLPHHPFAIEADTVHVSPIIHSNLPSKVALIDSVQPSDATILPCRVPTSPSHPKTPAITLATGLPAVENVYTLPNHMKPVVSEPAAKPLDPLERLFTYDVCLVFQMYGKPDRPSDKVNMNLLRESDIQTAILSLDNAGLQSLCFMSSQKDELFCLVGASEARLIREADATDIELLLDPVQLRAAAKKKGLLLDKYTLESGANVDKTTDEAYKLTNDIWNHIYGQYDPHNDKFPDRQLLYSRYASDGVMHQNSLFSTINRLSLTWSVLEGDVSRKTGEVGCGFEIEKLVSDLMYPLVAMFPLHQPAKLLALEQKWLRWDAIFSNPINDIRDYFGEKIAMYYACLRFYSVALCVPSLMGVGWFIVQMVSGSVDTPGLIAMAIFMAIWSTLFLEFWRRSEAELRMVWGQEKFLETETVRPEFRPQHYIRSPVDGKREKYFNFWEAFFRVMVSRSVILILIMGVIACVISIFFLRNYLMRWDAQDGGYITSLLNALQIQILNYAYSFVSKYLTDWENHRSDTEYENAMISKTFLFKFVNSYNSLFYIAFFKQYDASVGYCRNNDCLSELQQQLGVIFVVSIFINNALEYFKPLLKSMRRSRQNAPDSVDLVMPTSTTAESQYILEPFESTFDDYDEMAIQFGYVTMFCVAFPVAPLLALCGNIVEMRLDAYRLCHVHRRPIPFGVENIGEWFTVFNILSHIAVITNIFLIVFQTKQLNDITTDPYMKLWIAVGLEHLIFGIKYTLSYSLPDVPTLVTQHIARTEFLVKTLLEDVDEDDDPNENATIGVVSHSEEIVHSLDNSRILQELPVNHHIDLI